MRFNTIFFLFLVLISFSCSQPKKTNETLKSIDLKESRDALPISSFIDELDYLELKASEANIEIGEIQDIKVLSGDLIIKQRKAGEISIIRFSEDGEFIAELINNKKYKISNPLDIVEYQQGYAVLSENGIHLVSKHGTYKGKIISEEINGNTFFRDKNNFLVINRIPAEEFLSTYTTTTEPKYVIKHDERINKWIYTDLATIGKKEYHLISSFCDTVYTYKNNKLSPKYKFNAGDLPTLSEVWKNVGDRDPKETMRYIYDTQHVLVRNYLENDEIIFITYWLGSASTTIIIKKENWEIRYFAKAFNDIDGGIWEKPLYLSAKNELYIPISSYKIEGHKISNKYHKDFKQLQEKMANNGNPVIMRCKLE